jgi:hypothetical protein
MQLDPKIFAGAFSYYSDGSRDNPVSYLYAQDVNNDGVDEVLFVAFETQISMPLGAGPAPVHDNVSNTSIHIFGWQDGVLKEVTQQWLPGDSNLVEGVGDVAFGDFNGDGLKDVFLSAYTDIDYPVNAYVLYNTGAGFNKVSMGLQTWQHSVRSYDINQDGYADVIPVGYADMPRYMGSANGLVKFSGFTGGSGLALGDFMNNGKASVIFTDAGKGLSDTFLYNFDFSVPGFVSTKWVSQLPGPRLESIAPTASSHDIRAVPFDFNDDGLLDVIVISYGYGLGDIALHRSEVQFLLNKSNGVFEDVTSTYRIGFDVSGYVSYMPQLVDINQDGRLDLFLSQPDWLPKYNSTTLLLQQQDKTFVDTARSLVTSAIDSRGGQGVIAQGPNKTMYLVTEGAWDKLNPLTKVYSQKISFLEREMSEILTGTLKNDTILGFGGDDQLYGNSGNDALDGGSGNDTAAYIGNRSNYTLTKGTSTYTVTDKTGSDGTDTLTNVENLTFSNVTLPTSIDLFLATKGTAVAARGAVDVASAIATQISVVYLGRPADKTLLLDLKTALGIEQPSAAVLNLIAAKAIQDGAFSASNSSKDIVVNTFNNIMGFLPSAYEQTEWAKYIDNGTLTKANAPWIIFQSYLGANNVPDVYKLPTQARFVAAQTFSDYAFLDTQQAGLASLNSIYANAARKWLSPVDSVSHAASKMQTIIADVESVTLTGVAPVDSFVG